MKEMDIEKLLQLLRLVPNYYGVYFETKTNNIALASYIYIDKKQHNIILTDLPYTDYEDLELLEKE